MGSLTLKECQQKSVNPFEKENPISDNAKSSFKKVVKNDIC